MLLETRTVSPKTARDGKLEVSSEVAARLETLGSEFAVETPGGRGVARATSMTCSCGKGASAGHIHYFVESELFQSLAPGAQVRLELEETTRSLIVRG